MELELLSDPDQYLFFEQSICGGVSASFKRLSFANNRYMGHKCDRKRPEKYIIYLDMNNLYGFSMSQPLPVGEFRWLENWEIDRLSIANISAQGPLG